MITQIALITRNRVKMRFHMIYDHDMIEDIPTYDIMEDRAMAAYSDRFPDTIYEIGEGFYNLNHPSPLIKKSWGFVTFELEFLPVNPSCQNNAPSRQ